MAYSPKSLLTPALPHVGGRGMDFYSLSGQKPSPLMEEGLGGGDPSQDPNLSLLRNKAEAGPNTSSSYKLRMRCLEEPS
jgi:hypothetical protein